MLTKATQGQFLGRPVGLSAQLRAQMPDGAADMAPAAAVLHLRHLYNAPSGQAIEVSVHAVAMAAALATLKHGGGLQPVPSARQAVLVRQAFVQAVWPALVEFDREKRIPGMPASAQAAWQLARSYTAGGHIAWRSAGTGAVALANAHKAGEDQATATRLQMQWTNGHPEVTKADVLAALRVALRSAIAARMDAKSIRDDIDRINAMEADENGACVQAQQPSAQQSVLQQQLLAGLQDGGAGR
ncbi:hypothetical protein COHA_001744 [Chlorella ohadii]|uniref:Uncharacterized protein n=1 Tax=Chlorella ohadii TaxID=2649997 RepID=A0AAD5H8J8_9CHLO|nr:hypothetical protein COHA_001744 [Chlorella ohadii]